MTTNPTAINDFQLSMVKEQLSQLAPGSCFVPCDLGAEYFKPFKFIEVLGLDFLTENIETGEVQANFFTRHTKVVRCVPHGTKPKIRVIDVIVDSFADKLDMCKGEYKSPAHIIFDRSTIFGVFEPIPSTKGLVLDSIEHIKANEDFDAFYEKCERFDFDLADFFAWAMMAGKLDDYSNKTRGGMVSVESPDYPDSEVSAKGRKYVTFEWAYNNYFVDADFIPFMAEFSK